MEGRKSELLQRIESDREVLLDFLRCFIRCQSPNPPGEVPALFINTATSPRCHMPGL